MQQLLNACFFAKESEKVDAVCEDRVDMDVVREFVGRGRTKLIPVGDGLVSVSVKEGSQGDVRRLFCGARSLVVEDTSGNVYLRGINKFFDFDDVDTSWVEDAALWDSCVLYAQRKMAGFVVTIFSPDGVRLQCMSKHAFDGPHVDAATAILHKRLSSDQRARMARELSSLNATVSCECVSLEQDYHHPVLENSVYDNQLVVFAIQRRHTVQEQAMPFPAVRKLAAEWGLLCTQGHHLENATALAQALASTQHWHAEFTPFGSPKGLAEGLVVLVETPIHRDGHGDWVRPLRLKAKTVAYVALRSLRSLIRGDSRPQVLLFHKAVLAWAATQTPHDPVEFLKALEERSGVSRLEQQFRASVLDSGSRRRHRGSAMTVGEAHEKLLRVTEQQITGAVAATEHPRRLTGGTDVAPLTTLLLCGLPGSGKSTLCDGVMSAFAQRTDSPFGYGVILRKDDVTATVSAQMGITPESSKHKKRRLGAPVHREVLRRLELVRLFASTAERPVLLLFDACNATPNTRRVWRQEMTSSALLGTSEHASKCRTVYVRCSSQEVLTSRLGARPTHALLADPSEAQRALYNVSRKFVPPAAEEEPLSVDTASSSCAQSVAAVLTALGVERDSDRAAAFSPLQPLTYTELEKKLLEAEDKVIHALLGLEHFNSAPGPSILTEMSSQSTRAQPESRTVIGLCFDDATARQLRDLATTVVTDVLSPETPGAAPSTEPGSFVARLASTIKASLWGISVPGPESHPRPRPTVLAGHTRWLGGWLFRGKTPSVVTTETVSTALAERFGRTGGDASLHMTLLYSVDGSTGVDAFWADSGFVIGTAVAVIVEGLLIDRHAVCLATRLACGERLYQWPGELNASSVVEEETEVPLPDNAPPVGPRLHITVGTAPGIKPGYCGDMFPNFAEWEAQNAAIKTRKERKVATRSQEKFINFLHVQLPHPITLRGTVTDLS